MNPFIHYKHGGFIHGERIIIKNYSCLQRLKKKMRLSVNRDKFHRNDLFENNNPNKRPAKKKNLAGL